MPNIGHLEDEIRRSSSIRSMTNFFQYLEYASHCRDELQVYFYMQQNIIGTDHPQFWLAMFNLLKLRCQFKLIIKKLLQIKKNIILREHNSYHKILEFEDNLTLQLEQDIRKIKGKKRRSFHEFDLFSISKIQKKKRKVGGIQIYVDQNSRQNYKLQDYSEFFINHMKDEIEMRRFEYDRKRANKPLSFLGLHESNIQKWSFQLIDKNRRNSFIELNSNVRDSNVFKVSNNYNNVSKRFSVSRKSNMNLLLLQNNPQSAYKTPKQIVLNQSPIKHNHNHQQKNQIINDFNKKEEEDTLNTDCVKWSMIQNDNKKMVAQSKIDRHLKQTILQTQLENVQTFSIQDIKDTIFHLQPTQSMYENYLHFQQQTQSKIQQSLNGFVMFLKSTQTFQSIGSNQQNLFSTKKQRLSASHNKHILQTFKQQIKELTSIQDNKLLSNNCTQLADQSIPRKKDLEIMSLQGNEQIQQMIDEMDYNNNTQQEDNNHRNLVLQNQERRRQARY